MCGLFWIGAKLRRYWLLRLKKEFGFQRAGKWGLVFWDFMSRNFWILWTSSCKLYSFILFKTPNSNLGFNGFWRNFSDTTEESERPGF